MMVSRNLRFRFTLVSYNILSQSLLNDHSYLYSSCNSRDLEWPRRGHRIVSELLHNQADIICLQEVESEHLKSLYRPKLARYGYECLYKKKTGYKIDGCAIFYKSKLFHLLNYKGIEFNRTDVTNLLNRDNVGIIAVLRPKITTQSKSSHLVIANTHLIFNPKRIDIKLAQLKFFLSELEELSLDSSCDSTHDKRCHYPTILCGDMNSTPDSAVQQFILKNTMQRQTVPNMGSPNSMSSSSRADPSPSSECRAIPLRDDEQVAREVNNDHGQDESNLYGLHENRGGGLTKDTNNTDNNNDNNNNNGRIICDDLDDLGNYNHTLEFRSVYPTKNKSGQNYVSTFANCVVDYIFYTPKLRLDSYRELLTEKELREIGSIPNCEFPSDHLTLEATFTLK